MKLNSKDTFKKSILRGIGRVSLIALGFSGVVNAHSMVAQHGHVSMIEFNHHRKKIMSDVKEKVYLATQKEKLAMEGLLLSPSHHMKMMRSTLSKSLLLRVIHYILLIPK